jgi:hypothetical protein
MATKQVKLLSEGDVVKLTDPEGAAKVSKIGTSGIFEADGGAFLLDLTVTDGPHKGEKMKSQLYAGNDSVELA